MPDPPAEPRSDPPPTRRPRVLVIRGGAIGDFILTLPAIQLLRSGLPDPHLELLGYPPVTALALAAGLADAARPIEHAGLAEFFVPGARLDPAWSDYFASFDLVLSYLYDPDGIFQANIERTGVETFLGWAGRVDPALGVHAAAQLAKPLEKIALFLDDPAPRLTIGGPGSDPTAGNRPGPLVAIHPGSGSPRKNWGFESWAKVASAVRVSHPTATVLLATGEAEHDHLRDLLDVFRQAGVPVLSRHATPLTNLARDLAGASLFLGADSGIGHLAAALGVPCVLVFGPTDPSVWAPKNQAVTVLQAPGGNLAALAPEPVADAALKALGQPPATGN